MKKETAGSFIKCKMCGSKVARIIQKNSRYKVVDPVCGAEYYLGEHWLNKGVDN